VAVNIVRNDLYDRNIGVLRQRFPEIAAKLSTLDAADDVTTTQTDEGPTLHLNGQPLDHPQKPVAAAAVWAKRALQEGQVHKTSTVIIIGFGSGYHIEALLKRPEQKKIWVVEPKESIFLKALSLRDISDLLSKIEGLIIGEEIPSSLPQDAELLTRPQHHVLFPAFCAAFKAAFYGVRGISSLHPTIGVVGPLQGGTLPITAYTVRALHELKQRFREFDVSGYAPGFHLVEKFIFDKYRVAGVHGTYVEMVSHIILESLNEKPVDILICMAQAPVTGRLLTELRKRGVITVLWFMEDYLRFTYWKDVAQYYDYVFTIQKGECLDLIRSAGAGAVHYLPAGCDPFIHAPAVVTPEEKKRWGSSVSFVGAGYHNRQQMFASLSDLPFKIWGTEWPTCRPFDKLVQEEGRRLTPAEYVKIFNSTDININLHSSTERDGVEPNGDFVNPRTLELASAGAFQLVDERTHLPDLLTPDKEVITFKSLPDLKEKIAHYLKHPDERKLVTDRARERVIREHTYVHRIREMLSIIYNSKYEHLKRRLDDGPWSKMLARTEGHP